MASNRHPYCPDCFDEDPKTSLNHKLSLVIPLSISCLYPFPILNYQLAEKSCCEASFSHHILAGAFPILIKPCRAALEVGPASLNRRIISSMVAPFDELQPFPEYTMFSIEWFRTGLCIMDYAFENLFFEEKKAKSKYHKNGGCRFSYFC